MKGIRTKKANIELHCIEAPFYEEVHFEIFNKAEQEYIKEKFSQLWKRQKERKICLDMGCGTGNIAKREQCFFDQVVGIDISKEMLLQLKSRKGSNLSLVCGDCENLPFRRGIYNFISMYSTLHHLPSPFLALKEMLRTLKRGGVICISHEPNVLKYNHILYQSFLHIIKDIFALVGQFLGRKSSKYPRLVSCQKRLGRRVDIYGGERGFASKEVCRNLESIGFSNVNIAFHDFLQWIFAALPSPFDGFYRIDHMLEKNKFISPLCDTIIVTAEKAE